MRTLLAIGVVLWGTFSFAADERSAIQNEFLRVTADGGAGEFSIQALPSQSTIIRAGRLSGSDGSAEKRAINDATFGAGGIIRWGGAQIALFPKLPFALVKGTVKNATGQQQTVNRVPVVSFNVALDTAAKETITLGTGGLFPADKNPGSYTWLAVAEPKSRYAVVAGWLTQDRASGILFTKTDGDAVNVSARSDYGRLRLAPGASEETESLAVGFFAAVAVVHWLASLQCLAKWWRRTPEWLYAGLLGTGLAIALYFVPQHFKAFIYFQF